MATQLEFINSFDSGTGNSLVSCDNVFSDKYKSYFVTLRAGYSAQGYSQLRLLNSSGSPINSATYDCAIHMIVTNAAFQEYRATNAGFLPRINYTYNNGYTGTTSFYVHNPYDSSSFTFFQWQNTFESVGTPWGMKGIGVEKTAQTCRGFDIYVTAGVIEDNIISVYGVK